MKRIGRRAWLAALAAAAARSGTADLVRPSPRDAADEAALPPFFRLGSEPFAAETAPAVGGNGLRKTLVTFPSPVVTPHAENNTVHAELYAPEAPGRRPAVIVLHIAGGDFPLARLVAANLAYGGVSALFLKLPYYGERRPPGGQVRMLGGDLDRGVAGMKQAVLDLRRAADWLQAHPDCDGRLGIMGVSLGAIVGGLAAAIEPRLTHACLVMGGAHLQHVLYDSAERDTRRFRERWEAAGGTRAGFAVEMAPVDAATYAPRLSQRIVCLHSAAHDEVIPRRCNDALWEATGRQRNQWYPCGHYTMARHLAAALADAREFFRIWPTAKLPPAGPAPSANPALSRTLFPWP